MRSIRRDVEEESPVAFGLEESPCIPKSNVGEVALEPRPMVVHQVSVVEVVIAEVAVNLCHTSTPMPVGVLEQFVDGAGRIVVEECYLPNIALLYPLASKMSAIRTSRVWMVVRACDVRYKLVCVEQQLVIRTGRVGEKNGLTWKSVKQTACSCNRLRLGIRNMGVP